MLLLTVLLWCSVSNRHLFNNRKNSIPLDCDVLADEDIVEFGTVFASEGSEGGCGGGTPGIPAPINIGLKRMGGRSWPACAIIANRSGLGNGIRVAIAIASCCCCHGLKCRKFCGIWPFAVGIIGAPSGGRSGGGPGANKDGPIPEESKEGGIESRPSSEDFPSPADVDARSRSSLLLQHMLFASVALLDKVSAMDQILLFLCGTAAADKVSGVLSIVPERGGGVADFEWISSEIFEMRKSK